MNRPGGTGAVRTGPGRTAGEDESESDGDGLTR
jgi:hypothetical protein